MPALPQPWYGLDSLYLFRQFQTREEYEQATGKPCPPWTTTKPPKSWFDPSAASNSRRNIVYENVVAYAANGSPLKGPDGNPVLESMVLSRDEAATVNIPPKGPGVSNIPGADVPPVPVPIRALEKNEELYFGMGGGVFVRNLDYQGKVEVGFTNDDRALLKAIAGKLGVAA